MKSQSKRARKPAQFAIDQIKVGNWHRKDLGDIPALAGSIKELGLLHPIGITPQGELIFGRRRLEAYKHLGRKTIPVRIFNLDDTHRLLAQRDENTERKELAPTEAVAIGRAIERRLRPIAEQRMKSGTGADGKAGGRGRKKEEKPCAKLAQGFGDFGKTTEKAALAAGMSRATYEKAKAVVEAAEADPQKYGDLPQQMDEARNVDRAYRELKSRNEATPSPDLQNGFKKNLAKKRPPAYDRLSDEVKTVFGNSELTYDRGQVEELALLDPLVQEPIARMLMSREALSVGAAMVLILEELFLRPAEALRRALRGLGETALGDLHKLYDELELVTAKGSSNSDGQACANRVASSPAEVKPVEVATPPEKAEEKVTLTYTVCGFRDQDGETCCWGLESREAAAAWLRENYATACQGMNVFWLIRDDNDDAAAVYATVNDGEWAFALVNGEPVSL
jgi:hypothetical protein